MNEIGRNELIAMGRDIPTPFHLALENASGREDLTVDSILRILPGKRITALSTWRGTRVIAKLFFEPRHWKRKLAREAGGINALSRHEILTPAIIQQFSLAADGGGVLLLEYLNQGINLGELFNRSSDDSDREQIIQLAVAAIAKCHRAGLWQADIHLDNFMVANGRVYVLDGGNIKGQKRGFTTEIALENLALFHAQFPVAMDAHMPGMLNHYRAGNPAINVDEFAQFPMRVRRARINRLAMYEKKLFRATTANNCRRDLNRFVVYDRKLESDDLGRFINDPDRFIDAGRLLKAGNTSTVAIVTVNGREFVVKRYNIKGFWHGLKRALQPSRAHHCWRNAAVLAMLGIDTPRPLLCMERRRLRWLRREAYFLCEKLSGDNLLEQLEILNPGEFKMETLVRAFDQLLQVFREYNLSHGDMKASNFVFQDNRLFVLDLDAMQRHAGLAAFEKAHARDLERFMRNWQGRWIEKHFIPLLNQPGA